LDDYDPTRGRRIKRLSPPQIDKEDAITGQARYSLLTRDSGTWEQYDLNKDGHAAGDWYNTGRYGHGRGIYIGNRYDRQLETPTYSLPAEWTTPGGSENWVGPQYIPPGVEIVIYPYPLDLPAYMQEWNDPQIPDIKLVRYDGGNWYRPDGETPEGNTIFLDYPENGVIYAEGNIRVRGTLASPNGQWGFKRAGPLTIVSYRTIYIEGNILKERGTNPFGRQAPYNDTGVALLAREYICINTTRFCRIDPGTSTSSSTYVNVIPPFEVVPGTLNPFQVGFDFGQDFSGYPGDPSVYLLMEHSAAIYSQGFQGSDTVLWQNFWVNGTYQYSSQWYQFWDRSTQIYPNWEQVIFPLEPPPQGAGYLLRTGAGQENIITWDLSGAATYLNERVMVQPLEIRIEAALFAQEKSFFIIPGYWMNNNSRDTLDYYSQNGFRYPGVKDERYPFYQQPLDAKIVIVGSVAENVPASGG
ncbi:unnamed protein product, partial [marine sediment metagenome]